MSRPTTTMKRARVGSLSLPSSKRSNKTKPSYNVVFTNNDIIKAHIMPFLTEWDQYNLAGVNKPCNESVYSSYPSDKHFMYNYFVRTKICMVCFCACNTEPFDNHLKLFCHRQCVPTPKLFTLNESDAIPKAVVVDSIQPGMVIHSLYDSCNPFIGNKHLTLAYQTLRKFSIYNRLYVAPEFQKYLDNVREVADSVSKEIHVKNSMNLQEKVRVGCNLVSLYTTFNKVYPGSTDVSTMVKRYGVLRKKIKAFHKEMVRYFSESIRPFLYIKSQRVTTTWGHFVKHNVRALKMNEITFIDWVLKHDYIEPRKWGRLKNNMSTWVEDYNRIQLAVSLKKTLTQVDYILGESLPTNRINVFRCLPAIVSEYCNDSPQLTSIVNAVPVKNVFKDSVTLLCDKMVKVNAMFTDMYKGVLMQEQSPFAVGGVRVCDFNVSLSYIVKQFGLFHFDMIEFPERFNALAVGSHPLDVLKCYNPVDFYTSRVSQRIKERIDTRTTCICGNQPMELCEEHGLCDECCNT